jgi:hypothetical protein
MKVEKFEDLVAQFSQHGLVVPPQFRTNALSNTLNGSVLAVTLTNGDKKVYVGIKYPESFLVKISNVHASKVVGKVDANMDLFVF